MRKFLLIGLFFTLAACEGGGDRPASGEGAGDGAAAPVLDLQVIGFPDMDRANLYGAGCGFAAENSGIGAVVLAQNETAYVKLSGALVTMDAVEGAAELPLGTRAQYAGNGYQLQVSIDLESQRRGSGKSSNYDGSIALEKEDGKAFSTNGLWQCGA